MRHLITVVSASAALFVADMLSEKLCKQKGRAKAFNLKTTEVHAATVREWQAVKDMNGKVSVIPAEEIVAKIPKKRGRPAKSVKPIKVKVVKAVKATELAKLDGRVLRGLPKAIARSVSKMGVTELQALAEKFNQMASSQVATAEVETTAPVAVTV